MNKYLLEQIEEHITQWMRDAYLEHLQFYSIRFRNRSPENGAEILQSLTGTFEDVEVVTEKIVYLFNKEFGMFFYKRSIAKEVLFVVP